MRKIKFFFSFFIMICVLSPVLMGCTEKEKAHEFCIYGFVTETFEEGEERSIVIRPADTVSVLLFDYTEYRHELFGDKQFALRQGNVTIPYHVSRDITSEQWKLLTESCKNNTAVRIIVDFKTVYGVEEATDYANCREMEWQYPFVGELVYSNDYDVPYSADSTACILFYESENKRRLLLFNSDWERSLFFTDFNEEYAQDCGMYVYVLGMDPGSQNKQILIEGRENFYVLLHKRLRLMSVFRGELQFRDGGILRIYSDAESCCEQGTWPYIQYDITEYDTIYNFSDTVRNYIYSKDTFANDPNSYDENGYEMYCDRMVLAYDTFNSYYRDFMYDSTADLVYEINPGRLYVDECSRDYTYVVHGETVYPQYLQLQEFCKTFDSEYDCMLYYLKEDGSMDHCYVSELRYLSDSGEELELKPLVAFGNRL